MNVGFASLELRAVRIPFRFSFRHALADRSEALSLIVSVTTDTGHTGYGEAVPRDYLTGETVESAWEDLRDRWWPRIRELSVEAGGDARGLLRAMRPAYEEADAARRTASWAGLDVAATDAYARACGIPGRRLFGQAPGSAALSAVVGGMPPARAARLARGCRALGFRQFKVKVGDAADAARLAAVRAAIGDRADLRADANGAWDAEEAIRRIRILKAHAVSSVEQPVGRGGDLLRVQRETGVPVMADESLATRADAEALLGDRPDERVLLWNVRLAKVGGFSGALELIALAGANGVGVHLGVLVGETSALAAAGRALLGLAEYTHVEYGFPRVLLRGDPFRKGPAGYFGTGRPLADRPGLGVRPNARQLDRVTVRRERVT